jgi:hypothetical protein
LWPITLAVNKPTHSYTLNQLVWYQADTRPFTVVGIRWSSVELYGDFSGGEQRLSTDWVSADQVEPWQVAFLGCSRKLHEPTEGSLQNMYRYVAAGRPTLLEAFDEWERRSEPWYVVQVLGRRPATIRKMLSHERPLWAMEFMKLCSALDLSIDEANARYWANAPADKIGKQQAVEKAIAEMHMMAEVRKLLKPSN